jgi:hypothetical protein
MLQRQGAAYSQLTQPASVARRVYGMDEACKCADCNGACHSAISSCIKTTHPSIRSASHLNHKLFAGSPGEHSSSCRPGGSLSKAVSSQSRALWKSAGSHLKAHWCLSGLEKVPVRCRCQLWLDQGLPKQAVLWTVLCSSCQAYQKEESVE